jgi:membrane associated rhomboid family serine protease
MQEVASAPSDLRLDLCRTCQFIWFDPGEFEQAPVSPQAVRVSDRPEVPMKMREAIARHHLAQEAERFAEEAGPDSNWQFVPAILGFPVEHDEGALQRQPIGTWSLSAVILLVSLLAMQNLDAAVRDFGLIPAEAFRLGGLTLVSSFFLHGGMLHLIGNLYFLMVFGDNVEDYLGRKRFLLLVALASLSGDLLHLLGSWNSTVPCIGASGGISGVIVFYALQFPKAKLGFFWRYGYVWMRWVRISARTALLLWLLLQGLQTFLQLTEAGRVSGLAHLGGALVGFLFWRFGGGR